MNADDRGDLSETRQALSALVDGEAAATDLACHAWRDDARARADWHAYHLIGELMRSDDVRCAPQRDAHFLGRLRERMASEPVVLAPAPVATAATRRRRRAWVAPLAVAAGFVAVAGVLVVTRVAAPLGVPQDLSARAPNATQTQPLLVMRGGAVGTAALPASAGVSGAEGQLIRNAELDRYLAAHRQYSGTSALAVPGGMVRNAAAAAPGR